MKNERGKTKPSKRFGTRNCGSDREGSHETWFDHFRNQKTFNFSRNKMLEPSKSIVIYRTWKKQLFGSAVNNRTKCRPHLRPYCNLQQNGRHDCEGIFGCIVNCRTKCRPHLRSCCNLQQNWRHDCESNFGCIVNYSMKRLACRGLYCNLQHMSKTVFSNARPCQHETHIASTIVL